MFVELGDEQGYLEAKKRFPKLSFDVYHKNNYLIDDDYIQELLPSRKAVSHYLGLYKWSLYEGIYEEIQDAYRGQKLHELIEKGFVDEGAKDLVVHYLGYYLLSISSVAAGEALESTELYEEAISPLLTKYPELVREAAIKLATTLIDDISNKLKDMYGTSMISEIYALECPKLRSLIDDPKFNRFLPAAQLEVAAKTLEEAAALYSNDPDTYDYLIVAYDMSVRDYEWRS
jgi:hypothetical protein